MMLLTLLRERQLDPTRGDVVIFNNTSAEHPATYAFTKKIKHLTEQDYCVPFIWIEYQTYEDITHGYWTRKPSWRMVNDEPYSKKNPNGYRYKGEVFEEAMSALAQVPNMQTRVCTQHMKIFTTNAFLTDWLSGKPVISRLGHHGETSRMTDTGIIDHHRSHGGTVPDQVLLKKKKFVRQCPHFRSIQHFEDFTQAPTGFKNETIFTLANKAILYGKNANHYISCLGIRADEAHRLDKIRLRIEHSKTNDNTQKSLFSQPPNEEILAPLIDRDINTEQVAAFWEGHDFDLELPADGLFSNCVYCMMKGKKKLTRIAKTKQYEVPNTPASIDWWIKMERKYSRNLINEERNRSNKEVKYIGFFGASSKLAFSAIKKQKKIDADYLVDENYIPCECID